MDKSEVKFNPDWEKKYDELFKDSEYKDNIYLRVCFARAQDLMDKHILMKTETSLFSKMIYMLGWELLGRNCLVVSTLDYTKTEDPNIIGHLFKITEKEVLEVWKITRHVENLFWSRNPDGSLEGPLEWDSKEYKEAADVPICQLDINDGLMSEGD